MIKLIMDIYREMYAKATPPADFDKLIETGEAKKEDFFLNYVLDQETQEEIILKHCKKLSKHDTNRIKGIVYLGSSPTFEARK